MSICISDGCEEPSKIKDRCKRHYESFMAAQRRGGYKKIGDFCKKGHKIEGDNAQFYMNHGIERVRCKACNNAPIGRIQVGDKCKVGHTISGANLMRVVRDGSEFFRCRECTRIRNRNRRQRAIENGTIDELREAEMERRRAYIENNKPEEFQKELNRVDTLLVQEIQKGSATFNSLNYLKLSKRAGRASEALEDAFENARAKCYDYPRPYIDYKEGNEPTAIEAYRLCEDCPLLVECGRFAAAYRPPIGVWAGEVWKDGKVVR